MITGFVAAQGGHLDGQWFTTAEWAHRCRAHSRMQDLGQGVLGANDYLLTTAVEICPANSKIAGQIALHKSISARVRHSWASDVA